MEGSAGDFGIGEAIRYGWRGLLRNLAPLAGIGLVVLVVNIVVNVITESVNTTAGRFGAFLLSTIVSLLVGMGWIRVALTVVDGGRPHVEQLIRTDQLLPYAITSLLFGAAVLVGLVLFVIPGIYVAARWGFATYAVIDEGLGVGAAFERSSSITEGRRLKLVLFALAILALNLVGLLAFVVGVILTAGVSLVAVAYVYRRLGGSPVADLDAPQVA